MHPFLFQIGSVQIPTYGLFAVLALIAAILLIRRYARVEGRDPSQTTDAVILTVAAGILGARLLEAIVHWDQYFGPGGSFRLLFFSTGTYVGGLIAGLAFGFYWFRRIHLPVLQGLDIFALVAAISDGVTRWGCFFSGCCWGTPTDLPWAVTFPEIARRLHQGLPSMPLHPTQIYLSLNALAILGVLVLLYRRKRFHGAIITSYVVLYSITRFFLETVRGDEERGFVFGGLMSTSQFLVVILAVAGIAAYVALYRRHRRTHEPDWQPAPAMRPGRVARAGARGRAGGSR